MQFVIREIEFGKYNEHDFLERNFDRFEKQFKKENSVPLYVKTFKLVTKLNPEAVINGLIKVVKEWKKS